MVDSARRAVVLSAVAADPKTLVVTLTSLQDLAFSRWMGSVGA